MLTFRNIGDKCIGRAEVLGVCTIEDGVVTHDEARPGFEVWFIIKLFYATGSEHAVDKVPTGIAPTPEILTSEELIVTNGEVWESVRHKTLSQLEEAGTPIDPNLYIVPPEDVAPRLQRLTTSDREHILKKIQVFCNAAFDPKNGQDDTI